MSSQDVADIGPGEHGHQTASVRRAAGLIDRALSAMGPLGRRCARR